MGAEQSAFEVDIDEFDPDEPTPLDRNQERALDKTRDMGRLDLSIKFLTDVPIQFFEVTDPATIKSVDLSVNKFKFLPADLWTLSNLEILDISSNEIDVLPDHISKLDKLKTLNLRHNFLQHLPQLGGLTNLECLNLEMNRVKAIPDLPNVNLDELRAKGNKITSVGQLGSIARVLDLNNNQLTEMPCCDNFSEIKEIYLTENKISALPSHIGSMVELKRFTLASNRISEISPEISKLTALTDLDLRENSLREFPSGLEELTNLRILNLSNNFITSLPDSIHQLVSLQTFGLGYNQLSSLPSGIENMTCLRDLMLGGNKFKEVPESICNLPVLSALNLSWNEIEDFGGLPSIPKLSILYLTGNFISSLPDDLALMRYLKEFYIAANKLTAIPDGMSTMKGMQILDISGNNVKELPSFKGLPFLERLRLEDNPEIHLTDELLSRKNTEIFQGKNTFKGKYSIGSADIKGKRRTMEDAVAVICGYRGEDEYYAVFDGHGGSLASKFSVEHHPDLLDEMLSDVDVNDVFDVKDTIKRSFVELNERMGADPDLIKQSGTTGVVCAIINGVMYIANVGDSRAVMFKEPDSVLRLSIDHKPDLPEEEKRIKDLGGFVFDGRVMRKLAVSRALGDIELQPLVSPKPYVNIVDISVMPDFLILACDGIWDVISDESACRIVKEELDKSGSATRAAMKLRDFAYLFGSSDNISAIVIQF